MPLSDIARLTDTGFAMPITVFSEADNSDEQRKLGAAEQVFITNGVLHIPGHSPVASYHSGWWRTRSGEPSACLIIRGNSDIWFESGNSTSERYGPFPEIRIAGGNIAGGMTAIAQYEEKWKTWSVLVDGSSWPDGVFRRVEI